MKNTGGHEQKSCHAKNAAVGWSQKCSYILGPNEAHELCRLAATHLYAPLIFIPAFWKRISRAWKEFVHFHPRPIKAGKMPFKCIKHKLFPKLRYVSCRTMTAKTRVVYTRSCKNFATLRGLLSGNWRYMASFTPSPTAIRRSFPLFPFSQTIENLISLSIYKFLFLTGFFRRSHASDVSSARHEYEARFMSMLSPQYCFSASLSEKRKIREGINRMLISLLLCLCGALADGMNPSYWSKGWSLPSGIRMWGNRIESEQKVVLEFGFKVSSENF